MGDSDSFFNHLEAFLKKRKPNKDFSTILNNLRDNEVDDLDLLKRLLEDERKLENKYKFSDGVFYALKLYVQEQDQGATAEPPGKRPGLQHQEQEKARFPEFRLKTREEWTVVTWPQIGDFGKLRDNKLPYVDKTGYFIDLFELSHVFLSRPRRFGKSLLISTLEELFLGYSSRFKNLSIYDKWNWEKNKFPVIRLNFSAIKRDSFETGINTELIGVGKQYGLNLNTASTYLDNFKLLVYSLSQLNKEEGSDASFVLLVDEYDRPVTQSLENPELVEKNLKILQDFLTLVKAADPVFSLVTGSARLARSGVFSGDNNRVDISLKSKFNGICGFTEYEIENDICLEKLMGKEISMEDLKEWYNGYSFGGPRNVFNPFSVSNCLVGKCLSDYWVVSGTPTLLARFCKTAAMNTFAKELIRNEKVSVLRRQLSENIAITHIGSSKDSLASLYFETGYLTLAQNSRDKTDKSELDLVIPNREIKSFALPQLLVGGLFKTPDPVNHPRIRAFIDAVKWKKYNEIYDTLRALFMGQEWSTDNTDRREVTYQRETAFLFMLVSADVRREARSSAGTCDLLVDFGEWKLLAEAKVLNEEEKLETAIKNAFQQAEDRLYIEKFQPDVVFALVFDTNNRTLFPRENNKIFIEPKRQWGQGLHCT